MPGNGKMFLALLVVGLLQVQILVAVTANGPRGPQVPCYFIFGDSLVDSGNNNGLLTVAKANYPPYGVDFPGGVSTGRFTNGLTIADVIGQLLGFDNFIPSYATATDEEISIGVNYGSGSAGILEETGSHAGDRISLDRQLRQHEAIVSRLSLVQRNNTFTHDYLNKCFYMVYIGSNDYVSNYFLSTIYPTSRIYTPHQYANLLAQKYSNQLTKLYELGARTIGVFGLRLIGCGPTSPCNDPYHGSVKLFNNKLKPLVDELNTNLSHANFTFINLASISAPLEGVASPNGPCCQTYADGQCIPHSVPCPNRSLSVFFDGIHSSEIVNKILATRSYNAQSPIDASPYDIAHLVQL